MRRKQKGFSLIELLIVVVIILVIAAVAIPNLVRSRMSANEASAVASIRTIVTSEIVYSTTYTVGYSANLASLIDPLLASGTKSGYFFTYTPIAGGGVNNTYSLNADPVNAGLSGQRHFYTDDTDVLRVNVTAVASPSDPPL